MINRLSAIKPYFAIIASSYLYVLRNVRAPIAWHSMVITINKLLRNPAFYCRNATSNISTPARAAFTTATLIITTKGYALSAAIALASMITLAFRLNYYAVVATQWYLHASTNIGGCRC